TKPSVVFADEPTGMLDSAAGREVLSLLRGLAASRQTVVMVTHDPVAAAYADRVLFLADGQIAGELHDPTAQSVAARMPGLEPAGDHSCSRWRGPPRGPAAPAWRAASSPWRSVWRCSP